MQAPPCRGELAPSKWCNLSLSFADRAAALVQNMTASEKASQLENSAPSITRLQIKRYQWWHESLHGIAVIGESALKFGPVTSWAEPIGVAASFNKSLFYALGDLTSTEGRQ